MQYTAYGTVQYNKCFPSAEQHEVPLPLLLLLRLLGMCVQTLDSVALAPTRSWATRVCSLLCQWPCGARLCRGPCLPPPCLAASFKDLLEDGDYIGLTGGKCLFWGWRMPWAWGWRLREEALRIS